MQEEEEEEEEEQEEISNAVRVLGELQRNCAFHFL